MGFCGFSKKDPDVFSKVIANLVILLQDDNVAVSKKVMLSMANLYRLAFQVRKKPNFFASGVNEVGPFHLNIGIGC